MSPKSKRVFLIDVVPPDMSEYDIDTRMRELEELVLTYGGVFVVERIQRKSKPDYKTYMGSGKLAEIVTDMKEANADLLILGNTLKPGQIFEINEKLRTIGAQARDRVDLILKIFEKNAKTTEARLQIELAAIKHMGPRIFGMGLELSRQAGGSGSFGGRGIGETNTERMRRHLKEKERGIRNKLKEYEKTRSLHREGRKKKGFATVGIVGYTNAGKSTLLNALTAKGVLAENKLFATLGTSVGKLFLPTDDPADYRGKEILFNDTIGFIRNLPPQLIDAFASTLEDSVYSDLLLHVIDASDKNIYEKIVIVNNILDRIGATQPRLLVCNKIDLINQSQKNMIAQGLVEHNPVFVSANTQKGFEDLFIRLRTLV